MKPRPWISPLFVLAALYDGGLGLLFLAAPDYPFRLFDVTLPNHLGYVQFPAALLVIFGLMFAAIAKNPIANRNLIPYGILLKAAYSGTVLWYWLRTDLPDMWKPLAVIDLVMGTLFVWAYVALRARCPSHPAGGTANTGSSHMT